MGVQGVRKKYPF